VTSRYAASALAPSTEAEAAVLCSDCGVLVADTAAHDKFHGLLRELAPARPRGETRGKA
jgi:hypothetical protein